MFGEVFQLPGVVKSADTPLTQTSEKRVGYIYIQTTGNYCIYLILSYWCGQLDVKV